MPGRTSFSGTSRLRGSWLGPLITVFAYSIALPQTSAGPPATRRDNVTEVVHGVTIVDPYRWLEDQNSPETRAWIEAQNAFTQSLIGVLPGRGELERRLAELLRIDVTGVPTERGGRYFFSRRLATQELAVICMRKGLGGSDEVLIDPHPMSPDRTTSVGIEDVSLDGGLLAYSIRRGGADETEIRLFDVDARQDLPDRLPTARYFGLSFTAERSGFYYTRHGEGGSRLYHHRIGGDPAGDRYVFGEGYGPDKIVFANVSEDGRYLLIHVMHGAAGDRTEIYYQDLEKQGPVVPIVNDLDARFFGSVAGDHLLIQTNWKAPRGRILGADLADPARERWREIVPEGEGVIEWVSPAGGALMVGYTESASSRLKVFGPEGRALREIALPAIGSVSGLSGRWTSGEVFYSFASFHIPPTVYRYDLATGSQEVWTRLEVPVRSEEFEVRQVWYESKDGTKVPMFLLHRQGIALDGANPALMTGYGGFNASETPYFSSFAARGAAGGGVGGGPTRGGGG